MVTIKPDYLKWYIFIFADPVIALNHFSTMESQLSCQYLCYTISAKTGDQR